MSANVLQLAVEIVHGIGAMLNISDAGNLRLTCRHLSEMLEPTILQQITLNINRSNLSKSIPRLRALAAGRSPGAARTTTRLVLVCFSPSYDPTAQTAQDTLVRKKEPVPPKEIAQGERRLKKYLFDAIIALKCVSTVSWLTHEADDVWVQTTITKALRGLPQLERLSLDASFLKIAPPVQRLQNLHDISLLSRRPYTDFFEETYGNVAKLLARNSQITSIGISLNGGSSSTDPCISLHGLFSDYPHDTPPLRLQHLALKDAFVKLDSTTLAHLRFLKSLNLSSSTRQNSDLYSSKNPSEIWDALGGSEIHLEDVSLTQPTASFLEYIEGYSGLRKITLSMAGFEPDSKSEELATRFWGDSLNMHLDTLERLHVDAPQGGSWCLGDKNLRSITKCRTIRTLLVSLSSECLELSTDPVDSESIVTHLIDNVSCYLPQLRDLTLSPTNSQSDQCDAAGNCAHAQALIREHVQAYIAPPSCRQLPDITIAPSLNDPSDVYTPARATGDMAQLESGEWYYRRQTLWSPTGVSNM